MYTLRARVIEGEIPMPVFGLDSKQPNLTEHNFEIIAEYSKANFKKLYDIGKKAWDAGTLSKYEILAWAGGANNHDGVRYLWRFRPDLYNFEHIPSSLYKNFDRVKPQPLDTHMRQYYDRFWRPLPYGFSLAAYESHLEPRKMPSLGTRIASAQDRSKQSSNTQANSRFNDKNEIGS